MAARDAQDVAAAVRAAARLGLRVAVQCTGHGAAADQSGHLLISTTALDECTVHAQERWVRVGAGVKWSRVVAAAAEHGLAGLAGSSSDVGVVGYTTGGGTGPMARTFGLASDRVRAFEVVTGDGVLRRVTASDEPELFWGLRGGKGVLGIVTAVELDLLPLTEVYGGALYFDGADADTVLRTWRAWSRDLPESVTTSVAVLQLRPCRVSRRCSPAVRPSRSVSSSWATSRRELDRWRRSAEQRRCSSTGWPCCRAPRWTPCTPTRSTRCPSWRARPCSATSTTT